MDFWYWRRWSKSLAELSRRATCEPNGLGSLLTLGRFHGIERRQWQKAPDTLHACRCREVDFWRQHAKHLKSLSRLGLQVPVTLDLSPVVATANVASSPWPTNAVRRSERRDCARRVVRPARRRDATGSIVWIWDAKELKYTPVHYTEAGGQKQAAESLFSTHDRAPSAVRRGREEQRLTAGYRTQGGETSSRNRVRTIFPPGPDLWCGSFSRPGSTA